MYFVDRVALGTKLATKLPETKGQDSVIICLKDSSLMTCISMAITLRCWIYPLIFEPLYHPDDVHLVLGALTQDGEFCLSPDISENEYEYLQSEFNTQIDDQKRNAMHAVNQKVTEYGVRLDKHVMNNRTVILAADILTSAVNLSVVKTLLKPLTPKVVYGVGGNITAKVSDEFHLNAEKTDFMDVLPDILFDDDHYFDRKDGYTDAQKHALAVNISTYWK